jgi:hypothetical protein
MKVDLEVERGQKYIRGKKSAPLPLGADPFRFASNLSGLFWIYRVK